MQFTQTPTKCLSPGNQDLKSRHALTNLLEQQIDLNEDLSNENHIMASQQRKLIQLLTQKDTQIGKYRNQLASPEFTNKSLIARKIQLTLFGHILKKQINKTISSSFQNIKYYNTKGSPKIQAEQFFKTLANSLHLSQKIKLISSMYIAGSHAQNQEVKQQLKLAGSMVFISLLNRSYLSLMRTFFEKAKENLKEKELNVEKFARILNNVISRRKREALMSIRIKPYEQAASHITKIATTSKKFLGLQLLYFQLSKIRRKIISNSFMKIKTCKHELSEKMNALFHILSKRESEINNQRDGLLRLRMHYYSVELKRLENMQKINLFEMKIGKIVNREKLNAFRIIKGERKYQFPSSWVLTGKKNEDEPKAKRKWQLFDKENVDTNGVYNPVFKKRKETLGFHRPLPAKTTNRIWSQRLAESNKLHAIQMSNCMAMMGAKLMNFQQLNEQIIRESKETLRRSQELEEKLEMKKIKEKEMTQRIEELMKEMHNKSHVSTDLNQALQQLSIVEDKWKVSERKCAKLSQTIESLEGDKAQLVSKIRELMESLQFIQIEYQSNKQEITELATNNQVLEESLQEKNREVMRLKEKYTEIEEEFNFIKKLSEKKMSASQGEKLSSEAKDLKNQINKLKKENKILNEKYEEAATHNTRLKTTNAELTKEAITLNEEKNSLKVQFTSLKETNTTMKRDMSLLESKLQKALHDLEEKKAQLLHKTVNEKMTPDYINQILDEKKSLENENRTLKTKIDKLNNLISSYDNNIVKQTEELINFQRETQALRDARLAAKNEIKDLNESLANLNRDKVNLMREMTLINDKNIKLDKDADTYRKVIEELQNEIQNYQLQMDMYVQVLKSMEDKMNRLESKSKLTMSMTSNNSGGHSTANYNTQASSSQRENFDMDEDELMNRLKSIKNKIEVNNS